MTMKGPLGFWPFPLINLLMSLSQKGQNGNRGSFSRPRLQPVSRSALRAPTVVNSEDISWTDWKGRTRNMSIKREVKQL